MKTVVQELKEQLGESKLIYETCMMDNTEKEKLINEKEVQNFNFYSSQLFIDYNYVLKEQIKELVETCQANEEAIKSSETFVLELKEKIKDISMENETFLFKIKEKELIIEENVVRNIQIRIQISH